MPAPIMDAGFYLRNPQGKRRKVYDADGAPRWERLPSSAGKKRHRSVLRDDGHVVNQVLTSHSANLDLEGSQANFYRKKTAKNGWFPTGSCPVVLAMSGQIDPRCLCKEVRADLEAGKGCQPGACSEAKPCHHVETEKAARQGRRFAEETKRAAAHKSSADKTIEAQFQTQADLKEVLTRMSDRLDNEPTKSRKKASE